MARFRFHLQRRKILEPDDLGLEFPDLHSAYLGACAAIPDTARDLLLAGEDPMVCAYIVCDDKGQRLMEVPFTEILSAGEYGSRVARRRPHGGPRSARSRDELALSSFRRMFGSAEAACVLLTPELKVIEITDFGARQSHVDPEAVKGASILDIFDLHGESKRHFADFWALAQAGVVSELVNLPYYVLDEHGEPANGWWNSRTWPIFDDDEHMIGLVEWATPFTRPTSRADTVVRVAGRSATGAQP